MTLVSLPSIKVPSSKRTRNRLRVIAVCMALSSASVGRSGAGSTDKNVKATSPANRIFKRPCFPVSAIKRESVPFLWGNGAPAPALLFTASVVRKPSNVVAALSIPLNS